MKMVLVSTFAMLALSSCSQNSKVIKFCDPDNKQETITLDFEGLAFTTMDTVGPVIPCAEKTSGFCILKPLQLAEPDAAINGNSQAYVYEKGGVIYSLTTGWEGYYEISTQIARVPKKETLIANLYDEEVDYNSASDDATIYDVTTYTYKVGSGIIRMYRASVIDNKVTHIAHAEVCSGKLLFPVLENPSSSQK